MWSIFSQILTKDIDIDIDNIYSTDSNWLHIIQFFMQHNHLKKKKKDKVKVKELTLYVRRPQLSPFLGPDAEATYKKGEREKRHPIARLLGWAIFVYPNSDLYST